MSSNRICETCNSSSLTSSPLCTTSSSGSFGRIRKLFTYLAASSETTLPPKHGVHASPQDELVGHQFVVYTTTSSALSRHNVKGRKYAIAIEAVFSISSLEPCRGKEQPPKQWTTARARRTVIHVCRKWVVLATSRYAKHVSPSPAPTSQSTPATKSADATSWRSNLLIPESVNTAWQSSALF